MRCLLLLAAIWWTSAKAVPLSTVPSFCTSNPDQCNIGSQSLMVMRGIGTNAYYVLEVDETTGEIPVSISSGLTLSFTGPTGDPVPSEAGYMGGIDDNGDLQGLHVDTSGNLQVDVLNSPTPTPSSGRTYADSVYLDYSSTNVTTGAWVEIDASTAAVINELFIDDTCGQVLELGTGAAAAETRKLLIPRGGLTSAVDLAIPAGTRLSLRAITDDCTAGDITITGLN